jgi:hypothetical protein
VAGPAFGPITRPKPGANLEMNMSGLDSDRTLRIWAANALPSIERKAPTMKLIIGTALGVVALGVGVALLAGKDDIRKFHRMRSM